MELAFYLLFNRFSIFIYILIIFVYSLFIYIKNFDDKNDKDKKKKKDTAFKGIVISMIFFILCIGFSFAYYKFFKKNKKDDD
jgi:4-hydroxybenzoate polyprenyltransferase